MIRRRPEYNAGVPGTNGVGGAAQRAGNTRYAANKPVFSSTYERDRFHPATQSARPPSIMGNLFIVMSGGAIGSGLRYLFGRAATAAFGSGYPWGTLGVNLLGGLAMGLLMGVLARNGTSGGGETIRLAFGVGLLGGFTTFSAFSLDMVAMIERGALATALGYVAASVIGAGVALFVGLQLTRGAA